MFIDKARIFIAAGRGGDGCISFRREKYVPLGGPDGGNGGKGGDIYVESDSHLSTLLDFTRKSHFKAQPGQNGQGSDKFGKGGEDLVIYVPVGTVVHRNKEALADLKEHGMKILAAEGGRGGRGNASFKTGKHTAPRIAEKGEPGEECVLELELKIIADVGLVGFPNAGKSTLLSRISAAKPKIADYPFTTLSPNLGVVRAGESKSFVVADIPGLIEGAHEGKGLGDEFLRHIQRTKVLVHIVDLFGFDEKTAYQNYRAINQELSKHSKGLLKKPMVVAANKTDLTDSKTMLSQFKRNMKGTDIYPISAVTGEGVKELLGAVSKVLGSAPDAEDVAPEPVKKYIYEPEFAISKDGGTFVVKGKKVEKLASMTMFDNEEALRRFQNILRKMGVEQALEENGIKEGDSVRIGGMEFTYQK
ncbi:MAG: GTPase ObgE [Endomicrobiales bacterium]|nr:GTPase ObgE [Endomicrobiales bacterium]